MHQSVEQALGKKNLRSKQKAKNISTGRADHLAHGQLNRGNEHYPVSVRA